MVPALEIAGSAVAAAGRDRKARAAGVVVEAGEQIAAPQVEEMRVGAGECQVRGVGNQMAAAGPELQRARDIVGPAAQRGTGEVAQGSRNFERVAAADYELAVIGEVAAAGGAGGEASSRAKLEHATRRVGREVGQRIGVRVADDLRSCPGQDDIGRIGNDIGGVELEGAARTTTTSTWSGSGDPVAPTTRRSPLMPDDKRVAVLGAGMHPWGKWGRNFVEYGLAAAGDALGEAGLPWADIQYVADRKSVV